jgi:polar amino acid transport system substrate-binding protein
MKAGITASFIVMASLLMVITAKADDLRINSNDVFPRSAPDRSGFEDRILDEAFRRLGYTWELIKIPSERALASLNRGEIDGDYVRIAGLEKTYPNLVQVKEPISSMDFGAFTLSDKVRFSSWEELRNRPIAMIIGWKIVEERTKDFPYVTAVRDEESLFTLLRAGRVDAVIYDLLQGPRYLARIGASKSVFPGPALEHRDMYLYLNRKSGDLHERLALVLSGMRKEGLINVITTEVMTKAAR